MFKKWLETFWGNHGDRIVFMLLAGACAGGLHLLGLKEQANTILIGLAMLCYNKARGNEKK